MASVFLALIILLSVLPTIIVINNKDKASKLPTVLVNIFFGWTIIGWFIALIMSVGKDSVTQVVVNNNHVSSPESRKETSDSSIQSGLSRD